VSPGRRPQRRCNFANHLEARLQPLIPRNGATIPPAANNGIGPGVAGKTQRIRIAPRNGARRRGGVSQRNCIRIDSATWGPMSGLGSCAWLDFSGRPHHTTMQSCGARSPVLHSLNWLHKSRCETHVRPIKASTLAEALNRVVFLPMGLRALALSLAGFSRRSQNLLHRVLFLAPFHNGHNWAQMFLMQPAPAPISPAVDIGSWDGTQAIAVLAGKSKREGEILYRIHLSRPKALGST
jgi:hypothetical protein